MPCDWSALTPLQRYVIIHYHGRAPERAAIRGIDRRGLTWIALIDIAFQASPLRTHLLKREDYQNYKSRAPGEWHAAKRKKYAH